MCLTEGPQQTVEPSAPQQAPEASVAVSLCRKTESSMALSSEHRGLTLTDDHLCLQVTPGPALPSGVLCPFSSSALTLPIMGSGAARSKPLLSGLIPSLACDMVAIQQLSAELNNRKKPGARPRIWKSKSVGEDALESPGSKGSTGLSWPEEESISLRLRFPTCKAPFKPRI